MTLLPLSPGLRLSALLLVLGASAPAADPAAPAWRPLFDGESLEGWETRVDREVPAAAEAADEAAGIFQVHDGTIHGYQTWMGPDADTESEMSPTDFPPTPRPFSGSLSVLLE